MDDVHMEQEPRARTQAWLASLLLQRPETWLGRFAAHLRRLRSLSKGQKRRLRHKAAVTLTGAAMLLSLGAGALARPPAVHAATITVTTNAANGFSNDGFCTISEAIYNANTDSQFFVSPGECDAGSGPDTINLAGNTYTYLGDYGPTAYYSDNVLPIINSEITIEGNGATIELDPGAGTIRLMAIGPAGSLTLNDTTLSGGLSDEDGGGLYNKGYALIQNSTFSGNYALDDGGAIENEGVMILDNTLVDDNEAHEHGGGISTEDGSDLTIRNGSVISNNVAYNLGGGLFQDVTAGPLTIIGSTITGNRAFTGGGIYANDGGDITVDNSKISDNTADQTGGGFAGSDLSLSVENGSSIYENDADFAAGIFLLEGTLTIDNSSVDDNEAEFANGGLFIYKSTVMISNDATIAGNEAEVGAGGANFSLSEVTVSDATISGNTGGAGGGFYNAGSTITVTNSIISDNKAYATFVSANGGGIYNGQGYDYDTNSSVYGDLTITDSTISGNLADDSGGGILNGDYNYIRVERTTVSDNTAEYGGGLANDTGPMWIVNSTVSGNQALGSNDSLGGGIFNDAAFQDYLVVAFSTVTDNYAEGEGGGIASYEHMVVITSIVSGNRAAVGANEIYGGGGSGGYNVLGDNGELTADAFTAFLPDVDDTVATSDDQNVLLNSILDTTLSDNGGPTLTHALVSGSPGIDRAPSYVCAAYSGPLPNSDLSIDQRGAPRNVDVPGQGSDTTDLCDLGAYEYASTPPPGDEAIFMSTVRPGTTLLNGSVDFGGEDVLKWDGNEWTMFFDGSQHNLLSKLNYHNIYALYVPDPNDPTGMLISFLQNKRPVPGIDELVNGQDLVRFNGTDFDLHFDGSDVGLTVLTAEKIDGLAVIDDPIGSHPGACVETLLVSTQGPGRVPMQGGGQLRFRGEDVLEFCATSLGDATAGTWDLIFDGSQYWNRPNWLFSLSAAPDGSMLYFTTKGTAKLPNNAVGGHSAVFAFDTQTETFSGPLFEARPNGVRQKVDALSVLGDPFGP